MSDQTKLPRYSISTYGDDLVAESDTGQTMPVVITEWCDGEAVAALEASHAQQAEEIARLRAENDTLKAEDTRKLLLLTVEKHQVKALQAENERLRLAKGDA